MGGASARCTRSCIPFSQDCCLCRQESYIQYKRLKKLVARAGKLAKPRSDPASGATSDADGSGELIDDRELRETVIREYWRILRGDIARADIFFAEKVKAGSYRLGRLGQ